MPPSKFAAALGSAPPVRRTEAGLEGKFMFTAVIAILAVFYAGAVVMTGLAWLAAWRGTIGYAALRDLTGIADRAVLRRFFGLADSRGAYRVSLQAVLRHRRRTGLILSDAPVHLLLLVSLLCCFADLQAPAAYAVACVALLHSALVAGVAVVIAVGNRQFILP